MKRRPIMFTALLTAVALLSAWTGNAQAHCVKHRHHRVCVHTRPAPAPRATVPTTTSIDVQAQGPCTLTPSGPPCAYTLTTTVRAEDGASIEGLVKLDLMGNFSAVPTEVVIPANHSCTMYASLTTVYSADCGFTVSSGQNPATWWRYQGTFVGSGGYAASTSSVGTFLS